MSLFNDNIRAGNVYGKRYTTDSKLEEIAQSAQLVRFTRAFPE